MKILNEKIVFNDKLIIEKAELENKGRTFTRLRLNRPDAATVLVLNTETREVILTKQFRYAIASKVKEPIFEIVAGKLDEGETPLQAAIRETEEEIGYKVKPEHMQHLVSCFVSPGYTSEKFHIFYAEVTSDDKISEGGGLAAENESIEVVHMPLDVFRQLISNGKIEDAKTLLAAVLIFKDL